MDLNIMIALPGLLTGLILGSAFSLSRVFRVLTVTCIALLLIWLFYESGESGIIEFFGSLYQKFYTEIMFYLPSLAGLILGLTITKTIKR